MNDTVRSKYLRLIDAVKAIPATPTAVVHPCDESSLAGAVDAAKLGIILPILVGPHKKIAAAAAAANIDITPYRIVDAEHSHAAAEKAVALVREGQAEMLMKGSLTTDELLGAVVRRDTGLRTERRLSHCFILDVPDHPNVLIITDAAINIFPTLEDKVDIVQNAIDLAQALRLEQPEHSLPPGRIHL
jgi:phosphate acetyltransferase